MSNPNYTPLVARLPASVPFVGPETQERERGRPFAARLGANESVFGPSPRAIAAMAEAAREAWKYGDSASHELRHALATHHGIAMEHILVGEGIDGLLGNLVRLLVAEGDAVVTSQGAYPTFNYHVAGFGGVLHKVPFKGDHEDPEALIARARETGAKLVYISNPDNPMGSWHGADVIERMIAAVPEGCLLVLDEAYSDTAPEGVIPPLAPEPFRRRAPGAGRSPRRRSGSGAPARHGRPDRRGARDHRPDRPRQRADTPALGHEFRHHRLRP